MEKLWICDTFHFKCTLFNYVIHYYQIYYFIYSCMLIKLNQRSSSQLLMELQVMKRPDVFFTLQHNAILRFSAQRHKFPQQSR